MSSVLCKCGCGGLAPVAKNTDSRRGYVKGEPKQYIKGHSRRLAPQTYLQEDRGHATPCWIWQRTRDRHGYGKTAGRLAHRVYFEKVNGPIPKGLALDHLCRQTLCVNPDHLEPVTTLENNRRSVATKLTASQVLAIRSRASESRPALAIEFGCTESNIANVLNWLSWKEIGSELREGR
jgi:hypothetical protein